MSVLRPLLVLGLLLAGCTEECVDQFDCLKIASKSALTCDDGRCVVKTRLPTLPSFGVPDGGRPASDAGASGDGGVRPASIIPGEYVARLSGGQLVPPVATAASGAATVTLTRDDAGVSTLAWAMTFTGIAPTNAALLVGAPAGRSTTSFLRISDGGVTSPFTGSLPLSSTQAEAVSAFRASFVLTSATNPFGELRGQIVPKGSIIGFTQFARAADGQYGGGGHLVMETDGGFLPLIGHYDFAWPESGQVGSASITQGGAPLLPLGVGASGTSATGTFEPLTLLLQLRDAGIFVTGAGADGGEVFRGDLGLSLR